MQMLFISWFLLALLSLSWHMLRTPPHRVRLPRTSINCAINQQHVIFAIAYMPCNLRQGPFYCAHGAYDLAHTPTIHAHGPNLLKSTANMTIPSCLAHLVKVSAQTRSTTATSTILLPVALLAVRHSVSCRAAHRRCRQDPFVICSTRTPCLPAVAAAATRRPERTATVAIRAAPTPHCTRAAVAAAAAAVTPTSVAQTAHERNGQQGGNGQAKRHNGCRKDAVVADQQRGRTPQEGQHGVLVQCRRCRVLPLPLLLLLLNVQGASPQRSCVQQRQRHRERR